MTEKGGIMGNVIVFLFVLIGIAIVVLEIAAAWRVFTKAGQPGWAIFIPIYNAIVLLRIAGRPGWWVILEMIPFVSFVITIIVVLDIARVFGKGSGFAVGMIFLSPIFYPILAFGSSRYIGPGPTFRSDEPRVQPAI